MSLALARLGAELKNMSVGSVWSVPSRVHYVLDIVKDVYVKLALLKYLPSHSEGFKIEKKALRRYAQRLAGAMAVLEQTVGAGQGAKHKGQMPDNNTEAPDVLRGGSDILAALHLTKSKWRMLSRLNKMQGGPIRYQGNKPFVRKADLVQWWAEMHDRQDELEQRRTDIEATKKILNDKLRSPNPHHARYAAEDVDLSMNARAIRRRKR